MTPLCATPAGAALAGAIAFACAAFPTGAAPAATQDAMPETGEPAGGRTIPLVSLDPESAAGRILHAIADWLERRVGAESESLKLTLDAPMRAEERNGVVTVRLPGARLGGPSASGPGWELGDLAIAVTPRSATAYDFDAALPASIKHRDGRRLAIDGGAIAGTWRSDLDTWTSLQADVSNLRAFVREGPALPIVALRALTLTDELVRGDDGLWDATATIGLSGFVAEGISVGGIEIASRTADVEGDAILAARRDFSLFPDDADEAETLADALAPLLDTRWGRSDLRLALHDLTVTDGDMLAGGRGAFALGSLEWHIEFDDRGTNAGLATRLTAAAPALYGGIAGALPPALIPDRVVVDVALSDFPLRKLSEAFSGPSGRTRVAAFRRGIPWRDALAYLDAADTSFEIRELRVAAPSYRLGAEGLFRAERASAFGAIGRVDVRIGGLSELMALAAREGEADMVTALLFAQGLGRPVFEDGADGPVYAYEIDLSRHGAVTVNGIPFDMLLDSGLSPP